MKKIALFLVTMVVTLSLIGCGQQNQMADHQTSSYNQMHRIEHNELQKNTIIHQELTDLLPTLKEWVKESLVEADYLDWEQFENVCEVREFKSPELAGDLSDVVACYPYGTRMIVVCPEFFDSKSGGQRTYNLMHELVHSLVGVGKHGKEEATHLFVEGITDYLTYLVLANTGLDYSLIYLNELNCIAWLATLYGSDSITEMLCTGSILDFVDEKAGEKGAGAKLHNALATIDKSQNREEVKEAILTEIDILRAVSGSNVEVREKLTEAFYASYAPYLESP